MDDAIRADPAHWYYWFQREDLATLGLLSAAPPTEAAAVGQ